MAEERKITKSSVILAEKRTWPVDLFKGVQQLRNQH